MSPLALAQTTPWSYANFPAAVRDVAFDAHGVAYVTSGDTITRIDPESQQALGRLSVPGAELLSVVPEPNGCRIAVSDRLLGTDRIHLIEDLDHPALRTIPLAPLDEWEYGSWSLAWVGQDEILVSSLYSGSGGANLRRIDIGTGETTILPEVRQSSMLWADRFRRQVLVAEANSSAGLVHELDPLTGDVLQSAATSWSVWDLASDGHMVVVPTYFGGFVYDIVDGVFQQRPDVIGRYADFGPHAIAFAPYGNVVFESTWSNRSAKRAVTAYPSHELTNPLIIEARPEFYPTSITFVHGRLAVSRNGHWLAVTLGTAVRFYDVRTLAADQNAIFASGFGSCPD